MNRVRAELVADPELAKMIARDQGPGSKGAQRDEKERAGFHRDSLVHFGGGPMEFSRRRLIATDVELTSRPVRGPSATILACLGRSHSSRTGTTRHFRSVCLADHLFYQGRQFRSLGLHGGRFPPGVRPSPGRPGVRKPIGLRSAWFWQSATEILRWPTRCLTRSASSDRIAFIAPHLFVDPYVWFLRPARIPYHPGGPCREETGFAGEPSWPRNSSRQTPGPC
jgi:hypothetical protein